MVNLEMRVLNISTFPYEVDVYDQYNQRRAINTLINGLLQLTASLPVYRLSSNP